MTYANPVADAEPCASTDYSMVISKHCLQLQEPHSPITHKTDLNLPRSNARIVWKLMQSPLVEDRR